MGEAVSLQTRRILLKQFAPQYRRASYQRKQILLDAFAQATGYHRRYGMWLLNHADEVPNQPCKARPRQYGPEVQHALFLVWHAANRMCTKRLMPYLPTWLDVLERHDHLHISQECRAQLLTMSAATADRLLRAQRLVGQRGISTTRPGTLLRQQIPIRTYQQWNEARPGFLEADLVAHCRQSKEGCYLYTLTLTDIATGWTECVPVLDKSQELVLEAFQYARTLFPFPILGVDSDCGGEFINEIFLASCDREHLIFTRGRPQVKNDQCYVEEKNGSIVRQVVGHVRLEGEPAYRQLAELYRALHWYVNCFQPSMKLIEKRHEDSRVQRIYDPAKTPLQRLLLSGVLSAQQQEALVTLTNAIDPVRLLEHLQHLQQAVFRCTAYPSADAPRSASLSTLQFRLEDCMPGTSHFELPSASTDILEILRHDPPQNILDWKRTSTNPFAEDWEQILAWVQANPERTSADIFRALQGRSPGRYRPAHLRTLQRGIRQIRRQLLAAGKQGEAIEMSARDEPPEHTVSRSCVEEPIQISTDVLASTGAETRAIHASLPPAEHATCTLAPTAHLAQRPTSRRRKRRSQTASATLASVSANDSLACLTVESVIQTYVQELTTQGRSRKTVEWHQTALGSLYTYLAQRDALLLISQLTRRDVRGWVASLRAASPTTGIRRSANTVRTYLRSAHAFGSWLVQQGYVERSPFETIALPKAQPHRIQLVKPDVFERLLLACQPSEEMSAWEERAVVRNRAFLWVLWETGMLVSEACSLRLEDMERKQGQLRIGGTGAYRRRIELSPQGQQALRAYVDQYRHKEKGNAEEKHLFLSETHCPLTPNAVTQLFVRLNARARLTEHPVSPSMLRETFAVRYLQAGGNPLTLQTLLGRVDLATIKRYQQVGEHMAKKGNFQGTAEESL